MTHSKAIKKLAEYGKRTYPKLVSAGTYKIVIETGKEIVGERLTATQKLGQKMYNKDQVQSAIRELNIKLAQKLMQYDS